MQNRFSSYASSSKRSLENAAIPIGLGLVLWILIGSAIYYPLPLHLQPCFEYLGYKKGACPESERAASEVLSLPIYPELTRAQQDEVVAAIREFYGR